jgi:hypothetical protein
MRWPTPGTAFNAVARQLGLNWRTVRKYATVSSWQDCVRRPHPRVPSTLDPYLQYLQQRWDEGEHNAKLLHAKLKAKVSSVTISGWRWPSHRYAAALPWTSRIYIPHHHAKVAAGSHQPTPPDCLATERLRRLLAHCPELDRAHTLVRTFATMIDMRNPGQLPDWLDQLDAGCPDCPA